VVAVAFRGPAYSDVEKDKAALDLLAQVAFGETSEIYQRLVLREQKVDILGPDFSNQVDPELFVVLARVKDVKDVNNVRDQIIAAFKRFTTEPIPQQKLDATRSRMRYGLAMSMDSSDGIASLLAPYISLRRTPETIDKYAALLDTLTPVDVRDVAAKYFKDESRTVVTLATKTGPDAAKNESKGGDN
jgi:zinc protease